MQLNPDPRLVVVSRIRNEVDIVEAFVRHHLAIASRMLVIDHDSIDGTSDVLNALCAEGLPLEVIHETGFGQCQPERMSALMRSAAVGFDGWIAPLDVDEFMRLPADGLKLPEIDGAALVGITVPMQTYVCDGSPDGGEVNVLKSITSRLEVEPEERSKVIIPSLAFRESDTILMQGNHEVLYRGRALSMREIAGLRLAHFSIRSPEQQAAKVFTWYVHALAEEGENTEPLVYIGDAFRKIAASFSEHRKAFRPESALPEYLKGTEVSMVSMVEDVVDYLGAALRYTPPGNGLDRLVRILFFDAERLALGCGGLGVSDKEQPSSPEKDEAYLDLELAYDGSPMRSTGSIDVRSPLPSKVSFTSLHGFVPASGLVTLCLSGGRGALQLCEVAFVGGDGSVEVLSGERFDDHVQARFGGYCIRGMGALYVFKQLGEAEMEIRLPAECAGWKEIGAVRVTAGFESSFHALGLLLTSSATANWLGHTQNVGRAVERFCKARPELGVDREEELPAVVDQVVEREQRASGKVIGMEATIEDLRAQYEALDVAHVAVLEERRYLNDTLVAEQSKGRFLRSMPWNRLALELRRWTCKLFNSTR